MGMLLACPIPIRRESMRVKFLVKQKDPSIFHCKFHPNIPIHTIGMLYSFWHIKHVNTNDIIM